jgi:hypothetical protein
VNLAILCQLSSIHWLQLAVRTHPREVVVTSHVPLTAQLVLPSQGLYHSVRFGTIPSSSDGWLSPRVTRSSTLLPISRL